jgi:hypothetical protein
MNDVNSNSNLNLNLNSNLNETKFNEARAKEIGSQSNSATTL